MYPAGATSSIIVYVPNGKLLITYGLFVSLVTHVAITLPAEFLTVNLTLDNFFSVPLLTSTLITFNEPSGDNVTLVSAFTFVVSLNNKPIS